MKSHIGMGSQRSVEELIVRAKEVLEELASCTNASGFIWMVIKKEGANLGGCSPNLKPYEAALNDEVEKATERPVVVTLEGDPPRLPRTERVLLALAKTRHVELHPIVAMMIQGLNEINNHKVPRVKALADPGTIPRWFPLSAEAYASRSQKMDLHQLFCVLDSIFNEVRGNVRSIRALHSMLDKAYKSGSCSIGTRAGMDSFFHFLEEEAVSRGGGRPNISSMVPGFEAFLRSFGNGQGFSAFGEYQAKGGMLAPSGGESIDYFGVSPGGGLLSSYPLLPVTAYQSRCLLPERYTEGKTPPLVNGLPHVQSDSLLHLLEEPVLAGAVNGIESVSSEGAGGGQAAVELGGVGVTEKVSQAMEKFAGEKQGKGFVWVVVTEKEGKLGGCSPGLRPYGPALMDEVERAVLEPISFSVSPSGALPKFGDVLRPLSSTQHAELHPLVATLISGMPDATSENATRKRARKDDIRLPAWFPLSAEKFSARISSLSHDELCLVLDSIFGHVRGQPSAISELREILDRYFMGENTPRSTGLPCNIGLRGVMEAFLQFLDRDARVQRGIGSDDCSGTTVLHRRSVFAPCQKVEEVAGPSQRLAVKAETLGLEDGAGVSSGAQHSPEKEERRQSTEQATGSERVDMGDEGSVESPGIGENGTLGGDMKLEGVPAEQEPSAEGSNSGKENMDVRKCTGIAKGADEGKGCPSPAQDTKPSDVLSGKSRKRSRLVGDREVVVACRGGAKARKRSPGSMKELEGTVYRPLPEKTPQAYDKMITLLEALERSSG